MLRWNFVWEWTGHTESSWNSRWPPRPCIHPQRFCRMHEWMHELIPLNCQDSVCLCIDWMISFPIQVAEFIACSCFHQNVCMCVLTYGSSYVLGILLFHFGLLVMNAWSELCMNLPTSLRTTPFWWIPHFKCECLYARFTHTSVRMHAW